VKRVSYGRRPEMGTDAETLWFSDRPEEAKKLDSDVTWLEFANDAKLKKAWDRVRDRVLRDWKEKYPGTRPSAWWRLDAPRAKAGTFVNSSGFDLDPKGELPEPRRKLSGKGRPAWEVIALAPNLEYGLPLDWTVADSAEGAVKDFLMEGSVDSDDPPHYESQASYLRRHGLLTSEEANRSNFSHAILEGDEPCKPGCQCGRHGDKIGTRGKW